MVDQVRLGQHGEASSYREQPHDIEMLTGLRFDRLFCRDNQQYQIDTAHPGQHVAHEALVPGNIDKSDAHRLTRSCAEVEVGETDVDGDAAPLFFFQAVRVGPGQGAYQSALAMVDMSCSADDYGFHCNPVYLSDSGTKVTVWVNL